MKDMNVYCNCGIDKCDGKHTDIHIVNTLKSILDKYHTCDNPNCGRGAICNYCALRIDIERTFKQG